MIWQLFSALMIASSLASAVVHAETFVSLEGQMTWQTRNDQRVPGDSGSLFSISKFDQGPFATYRLYVGHKLDGRHELRALYAPLELRARGRFEAPVTFVQTTFASGTDTDIYYKFNSYRLTYAYHFEKAGSWQFALGFTAKIRDAEVRVTQGGLEDNKANVGFVPLLNFQALREIGAGWRFRFDLDGLAAPQGRAFDAALFLERELFSPTLVAFGGYRTVEGGADNDRVYNFAWFHSAVVGLRGEF